MNLADNLHRNLPWRHDGQKEKVKLMAFMLQAQRPEVFVQVCVVAILMSPVWFGHDPQCLVPRASLPSIEAINAGQESAGATGEMVVEDGGAADIAHLPHPRVRSLPDGLFPCTRVAILHILLICHHVNEDTTKFLKDKASNTLCQLGLLV